MAQWARRPQRKTNRIIIAGFDSYALYVRATRIQRGTHLTGSPPNCATPTAAVASLDAQKLFTYIPTDEPFWLATQTLYATLHPAVAL